MKTLIVALLIVMLLPQLASAQEPTAEPTPPTVEPGFPLEIPETLPPTAEKGLEGIAILLASLAGLLGTALTDAIKRIPFLSAGDKSKLGGPAANLLAAIMAIASGYLMGWLGMAAGVLDTSGAWQLILFSWPAAKTWFEAEQWRRGR